MDEVDILRDLYWRGRGMELMLWASGLAVPHPAVIDPAFMVEVLQRMEQEPDTEAQMWQELEDIDAATYGLRYSAYYLPELHFSLQLEWRTGCYQVDRQQEAPWTWAAQAMLDELAETSRFMTEEGHLRGVVPPTEAQDRWERTLWPEQI